MYKLTNNYVIREDDGAWIPIDTQNSDYIAYLKWVEAGNVATVDHQSVEIIPV
jgi:hypothetical protein